jgi:hypothetical protein
MRRGAGAGRQRRHLRARGPGDAEYFDPTMHAAPLRRIAEETGGRFYTPDTWPAWPRMSATRAAG